MEERVRNMGQQIGEHILTREIELDLNKLRALDRLLKSDLFKTTYCNSDKKDEADKLIRSRDYDGLKKWLKKHQIKCLEALSSRELKGKARELNIKNYSRKNKVELIRKIQQATGGQE